MRSEEQMKKRLRDRMGLRKEGLNYHYDYMDRNISSLYVKPEALHYDDGKSDLDLRQIFDWRTIYGSYELPAA